MPSGERGYPAVSAGQRGSAGFALPALLIVLTVAGFAATTAEVSVSYRYARDREEELHFRGRAYVHAIRSFYMAEEQPQRRRLPTSLEELEADPRFPLKRHLRRLYDDPFVRKPTRFRVVTGSPGAGLPQGVIGVASTSETQLFRRSGIISNAGPALGVKTARDLIFQVDLKELAEATRPPASRPLRPIPSKPASPGGAAPGAAPVAVK